MKPLHQKQAYVQTDPIEEKHSDKENKQGEKCLGAGGTVTQIRQDAPAGDYIDQIFEDFTELHGDRCFGDDGACDRRNRHTLQVFRLQSSDSRKGKDTKENIRPQFWHGISGRLS